MAQPLLHIQRLHQYYDDGFWHHLNIKPDASTNAILHRYHLLLLQTEKGLSVHYDGTGSFVGFVAALTDLLEGRDLRFYLHNSNPYYANISNLPLDWAGQLNYHSQDATTNADNASFKWLNRQLMPRTISESGVIGQVVITAADLQQCLQVDLMHEQAPTFVIEMAARHTQWHYYICNRSERTYQQLSVQNDQGFVFESPKAMNLPTGEAALFFCSGSRTLALQQSISQPFHLVNLIHKTTNELNSQSLIQGLPIPQTDQLRIEHTNDGQLYAYSPMYVYF